MGDYVDRICKRADTDRRGSNLYRSIGDGSFYVRYSEDGGYNSEWLAEHNESL